MPEDIKSEDIANKQEDFKQIKKEASFLIDRVNEVIKNKKIGGCNVFLPIIMDGELRLVVNDRVMSQLGV